MQILLSCAKDMTDKAVSRPSLMTQPRFAENAGKSIIQLSQFSIEDIQKLLKCNTSIAALNKKRYLDFFDEGSRLQAALSYHGVAYRHLKAEDWNGQDCAFANNHLWITSFLYGLLRPMDGINTYRLEGNVKLPENSGRSMFDYWKPLLTDVLIDAVKQDDGILVHLATEEMTRLFDWKRIKKEVRLVEPEFLVDCGKGFKVVTVYAKMCRGAMARYIIKNRLEDPEQMRGFHYEGFECNGSESYTFILNQP